MQKENDSAHLQRFEAFMSIYSVDYSDAGCEFGWAMTDQPYTADYSVEYAMQLMDTVPQSMYNEYFSENNN